MLRAGFGSIAAVSLLMAASACDTTRLAANSSAGVFVRGSKAFNQHWDYEFAGQAAPANIMTLEGVYYVVPDNEDILLELAKGYTGYAYGWIEDDLEQVDPMNFEEEEHLRHRARLMYLKARNYAFKLVKMNSEGMEAARAEGLEAFEAWLGEEFDDAEDAPMLLWAGYSWGSAINVSRDDPMMVADLGFARALVERSVELDPEYYNAGGLTFLGVVASEELGGDPEDGRAYFERALELTDRKALIVQVNMARSYAVRTMNRDLYEELLREVIEAGDVLPEARLLNKIARRRAQRYLREAGRFF